MIDAAGGCLEICGEKITDTCLNDPNSAVEAICVSVEGVSQRQLARQLTAAALNCVLSSPSGATTCGTGGICSGVSIDAIFTECNNVCAGTGGTLTVGDCIEAIDCFNNGGHPQPDGSCVFDSNNCHERNLCPEPNGPLCFQPPGPAGSSNECNAANKNNCTVIDNFTAKSPKCEAKCGASPATTCPAPAPGADDTCCAPAACAHDLCTTDGALDPTCDPKVNCVCNTGKVLCSGGTNGGTACAVDSECPGGTCGPDPFCCSTEWDSECRGEAIGSCGLSCP